MGRKLWLRCTSHMSPTRNGLQVLHRELSHRGQGEVSLPAERAGCTKPILENREGTRGPPRAPGGGARQESRRERGGLTVHTSPRSPVVRGARALMGGIMERRVRAVRAAGDREQVTHTHSVYACVCAPLVVVSPRQNGDGAQARSSSSFSLRWCSSKPSWGCRASLPGRSPPPPSESAC